MIFSNSSDLLGGRPFISCPYLPSDSEIPIEILPGIYNPTISFLFFIQAIFCGIIFILIPCKYDNVRIFGRNIHTNYLSNRLWIWFFFCCSVCAGIDGTRYLLNLPYYVFLHPKLNNSTDWARIPEDILLQHQRDEQFRNVDSGLLLASSVLRGLVLLFLAMALQWQYVHRCSLAPLSSDTHVPSREISTESINDIDPESETTALLQRFSGIYIRRDSAYPSFIYRFFVSKKGEKQIFRFDRFSMTLFIFNLLSLYLNITPIPLSYIFFYIYTASFATLHIPIIILMTLILFSATSPSSSTAALLITDDSQIKPEGPTLGAKFVLFLATILNFATVLPPSILSLLFHLLSDTQNLFGVLIPNPRSEWIKCFPLFGHDIFSLMDIVNLTAFLSNMLFFVFMKMEFDRVKARTVWWTVKRVTGTFGFARQTSRDTLETIQ